MAVEEALITETCLPTSAAVKAAEVEQVRIAEPLVMAPSVTVLVSPLALKGDAVTSYQGAPLPTLSGPVKVSVPVQVWSTPSEGPGSTGGTMIPGIRYRPLPRT